MNLPKNLRPVLAKIHHVGDLGHEEWHEVVYYDDDIEQQWCCYAGSKTFKDGERVVAWEYADKCLEGIAAEQRFAPDLERRAETLVAEN